MIKAVVLLGSRGREFLAKWGDKTIKIERRLSDSLDAEIRTKDKIFNFSFVLLKEFSSLKLARGLMSKRGISPHETVFIGEFNFEGRYFFSPYGTLFSIKNRVCKNDIQELLLTFFIDYERERTKGGKLYDMDTIYTKRAF